jgi:ribosome production factor 1
VYPRSSRYAFRSDEKVALQEIGPRFTLKLRSLRTGLPAVKAFGETPKPLEFDNFDDMDQTVEEQERPEGGSSTAASASVPPKTQEYEWAWKVRFLLI